jgi:hypothetical protein
LAAIAGRFESNGFERDTGSIFSESFRSTLGVLNAVFCSHEFLVESTSFSLDCSATDSSVEARGTEPEKSSQDSVEVPIEDTEKGTVSALTFCVDDGLM